jgi:hypothetical protein
MHGVPHDLDLQPLIGSSITSIQIGKYQVNLTFAALDDVGTGDRGHIGLEAGPSTPLRLTVSPFTTASRRSR